MSKPIDFGRNAVSHSTCSGTDTPEAPEPDKYAEGMQKLLTEYQRQHQECMNFSGDYSRVMDFDTRSRAAIHLRKNIELCERLLEIREDLKTILAGNGIDIKTSLK